MGRIFSPLSLFRNVKKFYLRLPRKIKLLTGSLLGGCIGLIGGLTGFIIGAILGFFVQQLFGQFNDDREIQKYFLNPGASGFYEGEPGLAAFCGLGIMIVSKSGDASAEKVIRAAREIFPSAEKSLVEHICRIALPQNPDLNPDLLLESLMYRQNLFSDPPRDGDYVRAGLTRSLLGTAFVSLASSEEAVSFAGELRKKIDPLSKSSDEKKTVLSRDPWKILGISPQTPAEEIKTHYRRLAAQFHPDALQGLDEKQKEIAAGTFIAIREAYREITQMKNR